jgi:hypothetical protein
MKRFKNKKILTIGLVTALVLGLGGAAFAFYSSTGSGTGSAQAGTVKALTISQIGPGYNSLITGNGYVQDQCFGCATVAEFGNEVNLSTTGILSNVVVAMRNWGSSVSDLPMTLTFYAPGATPGSIGATLVYDTQDYSFAAANADGSPSVTNITFNFSSDDFPLPSPVVYGITYDGTATGAPSLNVALSSSGTDLTVGSDVYPGDVFVTAGTAGWDSDAGTCGTVSPTTFMAVDVWCSDIPPANYGAYGSSSGADIPAVEINVVGGTTPPLYPGDTQEVDFAITNPNPGNVYVNTVTIALMTDGTDAATPSDADIPGCLAAWFTINGSPVSLAQNIPSGLTQFEGVANILMINEAVPQNGCAGATIGLSFSSN